MNKKPLRIAVSAGEVSGDQHLASVVTELKKLHPNASFKGMGGTSCRSVGVDTLIDSEKTAGLMGFFEVVKKLRTIKSSLNEMKRLLREWKPDILLVVDYPDFHFQVASYAKKLGIKTFYYIPPKLWAWRKGRIKKIKKYIDHVAAIFPFEESFYKERGYHKISFVGHPFCEDNRFSYPPSLSREELCNKYNLDSTKPIILLLPGSRSFEIERHLSTMTDSVKLIRDSGISAQAVITVPRSLNITSKISESWVTVLDEPSVEVMKIADVGILKSGTCNLEAAFLKLPFVCVYWAPKFAEILLRMLVGISEISPVNILRPKTVIELLQKEFTAERIASEVRSLFAKDKREKLLADLSEIRASLSLVDRSTIFSETKSAPERVAALINTYVQETP